MSITCCPLSANDGDGADPDTFVQRVIRRGKTPWTCTECYEEIPEGARYEYVRGRFGDNTGWSTYRTCLSCVEIRDHFACNGYLYTRLWEDLEENFFPDMKAGGPCMDGLSPAAKARLFKERTEWLFRAEVEQEGAPPPEAPR